MKSFAPIIGEILMSQPTHQQELQTMPQEMHFVGLIPEKTTSEM